MEIQDALKWVVDRKDLSEAQMETVMNTIMTGGASPAQIGGLLVGLRMKGETIDEITGAARVMRSLSTPVVSDLPHLIDTCGTGGDSSGTFNISTAVAFVAAAAGCHVAKHGNRSVSSKSGSADLLEAAGVSLDADPEQIEASLRETGVGFMFAPHHHAAMKYAIGPRREMGIRTLFNLLGPLTNPARVPYQVIGVFSEQWVEPLAHVLGKLGARHAMVVHGRDGLDEITLSGPSVVAEWRQGQVSAYEISPETFGISSQPLSAIQVETPQESLELIRSAFEGVPGAAADVIALNAGAAIYVAERAETLAQGVEQAKTLLGNGQAKARFARYIEFNRQQRG
jgi:anthranilate phosphoribosyltransferase